MLLVEFVTGSGLGVSSSFAARAKRTPADQDNDDSPAISEDSEEDHQPSILTIPAPKFTSNPPLEHALPTVPADTTLCQNLTWIKVTNELPWTVQDIHERSRIALSTSDHLLNTGAPVLSLGEFWPFTTQHQARLFKHYIRELAPWVRASSDDVIYRSHGMLTKIQVDSCDSLAHFATEVPRRVPSYPILASSIYALSSRHLSLLNGTTDEESPRHAERCIQLLIKSLDDPFAHWDENLLAAVVIMRLHEELGQEQDLCYHLLGTRKILDSISAFAADGGLREAASWVSLRQHIYISLTEQQPIGITLENFRHSSVFFETSTSNEDWAKRIILIFARILEHAFAPPEHHRNGTSPSQWWNDLKAEMDTWENTKPWDFAPLWKDTTSIGESALLTPGSVPEITTSPHDTPRSQTSSKMGLSSIYSSKVWPDLLVAHQSQITGLQYYHLARIALALYDPSLAQVGFTSIRARQMSEKIVVDGIKNIVGLSVSNDGAKNAMFEAAHILRACGGYLRKDAEQTAAVAFLEMVQRKLGWRTDKTVSELRRVWTND